MKTTKEDDHIIYLNMCRETFNHYTNTYGIMRIMGESYESLCNKKGLYLKTHSEGQKLVVNIVINKL